MFTIEPEIFTDDHGRLSAQLLVPQGAPIVVRVVADSITDGGCRLITMLWEYARNIHAEVMTHRVLSRNLASSRAISMSIMRKRIEEAPAVPVWWGQNQKGMQADHELADVEIARDWWLRGRDMMLKHHEEGERLGLHKQIVNRVVEPWMQAVGLISATDLANLFHLRKHRDAEPTFQVLATCAWELFHNHMPQYIAPGGWHIPFVDNDDLQWAKAMEDLLKLSVGRCARTSYLTHDGRRDRDEDIALHDRLARAASEGIDQMHASPFEHQAQASVFKGLSCGNFKGWIQYRKMFKHEAGPDTSNRCERCGCWGGNHVKGCPNV